MKAFTFWNPDKPYEEVDVLVDIPLEFEEIEREKVVVEARGIRIPLASINHLIKMKETAGREQDKADIEALKKIKRLMGDG